MIKLLKKLWKKLFSKKEVVIEPTPQPKPQHCNTHNRFKKSCMACQEVVK